MKKIWFVLVILIVCFKSVSAQAGAGLLFYGVEMARNEHLMLYEFEDYAEKHPKAVSFIWKTEKVRYAGEGSVILAGYATDRAEAQRVMKSAPGSKILKIEVLPSTISPSGKISVYAVPVAGSEDSVGGDIWVKVGKGQPRRIEKDVLIGHVSPENTEVFRVENFSSDDSSFVYCLGECIRLDVKTGAKFKVPPSVK
jgi:hypothetical protein